MLPSKPRSDSSSHKTSPATPNVGKTGRTGSTKSNSGTPPPIQKTRASLKTVESKPAVERRAPKANSVTPDKQPRAPKGLESQAKGSELQAKLNEVQEDLKKAKEKLASVEQEKARVTEELTEAKKSADEANEKLKEALGATDIQKFRADELEQASIELSKTKEEEWRKELDSVKQKHALDSEALISVNRELEKVKDELEATKQAKVSALSQAGTNAEKVELLTSEVSRLKSLLDSKVDDMSGDAAEMVKKLDSEVECLKCELEQAKQVEEKLVIMQSLVERLGTEADNAKAAESDSLKLVDEWKKKAELLEIQLTEVRQDSEFQTAALRQKIELLEDQLDDASQAEKLSSESRAKLEKQLEEVSASLQDAESEAAVLKGKVESLEIEVADVKSAEVDSSKLVDEWKKKAESLEVQLTEANQSNESVSDSLASVTGQLEDSNSSLQDVLAENTALQVKIESLDAEVACFKDNLVEAEKTIQGLKSDIQNLEQKKGFSEERNNLLKELEMARQEEEKAKKAMEGLVSALHEMSVEARETQERLFAKRVEHEDAHAQIEQLRLVMKNTEENYEIMLDEARYEIVCLKKAMEKLQTEAKGSVEGETGHAEQVEEPKAESFRLRENELQEMSHEKSDAASVRETNGELSNSDKEYDLLPISPEESSDEGKEEKVNPNKENGHGNGHQYVGEEEPVEVEKMKDFLSEMKNGDEAIDEYLEMKAESGSFDHTNGLPTEAVEDEPVSPTKQQEQQLQKKKKHGFKFSNLLKKKSSHK